MQAAALIIDAASSVREPGCVPLVFLKRADAVVVCPRFYLRAAECAFNNCPFILYLAVQQSLDHLAR